MKKIISLLAFLISFSISAQQPLIKPKQIEGSTAGSILTTTGTGIPTWTTNIPASTTKAWRTDGNAVASNTAFIGTTDNRTFRIKTNNILVADFDSLGAFRIIPSSTAFCVPLTVTTNSNGNSYGIFQGVNNSAVLLGNTTTSKYWYMSNGTSAALTDNFSISRSGNPNVGPFQITQLDRVVIGNTGGSTVVATAAFNVLGTMSVQNTSSLANIVTTLIIPTSTVMQIGNSTSSINIGASNGVSVNVSGTQYVNGLITANGGFSATAASTVSGTALNVTGASSSFNLFPTTTEGINVKRRGSATTCLSLQSDASSNASVTVTNADLILSALNTRLTRIVGTTAAPTVTAGSGLGTGAGTVISVTRATDLSGIVGVVTGTTALGTSAVLTYLTFNSAYGAAPNVILTPANQAARNLIVGQDVFVSTATTTFAVNTNTAALTAATTYSWFYQVMQ